MPQVIYAPGAIRDLQWLRAFLRSKNPIATERAAATISKAIQTLGQHPQMGRPAEDMEPQYRELLIDFGDSRLSALVMKDSRIKLLIRGS
jgi:plasmid stabilization system protein ParE